MYHKGLNFTKIKEVNSGLACPVHESVWLSIFMYEFRISGNFYYLGICYGFTPYI